MQRHVLAGIYSCGEVLVEGVFGGDEAAMRRPGPKPISLAEVAAELRAAGAKVSRATLTRMANAYLGLRALGVACVDDVARVVNLSSSHFDAVQSLPRALRVALLEQAEASGIPVRRLRERAAVLRSQLASRAQVSAQLTKQRRRRPAAAVAVARTQQAMLRVEDLLEPLLARLQAVTPGTREERGQLMMCAVSLRRLAESVERAAASWGLARRRSSGGRAVECSAARTRPAPARSPARSAAVHRVHGVCRLRSQVQTAGGTAPQCGTGGAR